MGYDNQIRSQANSAQFYCDDNKLYSIQVDVEMATSNTDNPLVLFKNPTGSGKQIFIEVITAGNTVTNVAAEFKLFHTPTVTANGTSKTPVARNINNSQPASVALVYTLPTVSSNGTSMDSAVSGQNSNSIEVTNSFSVCLQPDSMVLFTGDPSSNGRNASIKIIWAEVNV